MIGFKSNRDTSSPYLGAGWVMPLLESYIVQTGEDTFEIMKPTGYTSGFGRDPKVATMIGGVKGWKGEIGSNTIKLWAPCGWSLTYKDGSLAEMKTPRGKIIKINRDSLGLVSDVTLNNTVIIKIIKGAENKPQGIKIGDKTFRVLFSEKPVFQVLASHTVISKTEKSVSALHIENQDNAFREWKYGDADKLMPSLICIRNNAEAWRAYWNPKTKFISSDTKWSYTIETQSGASNETTIRRFDDNGEEEHYSQSKTHGTLSIRAKDGTKTVQRRFVRGHLAGKLRDIVKVAPNGEISVVESNTWNEDGRLIRKQLNGKVYTLDTLKKTLNN